MKRILLSFFGLVSARQAANEVKVVQAKLDTAHASIHSYEKDRDFCVKHIADQKATIDEIIAKSRAVIATSDQLIADQKLMISKLEGSLNLQTSLAKTLEIHAKGLEKKIAVDLLTPLQDLVACTDIPEKNCSCHLNPPCGDCEMYGGILEALESARAAIKKATT